MAGLVVPAIHALLTESTRKTWMPGTRPGMTSRKSCAHLTLWMPGQETCDGLDNARRDRQRRVSISRKIGDRVRGRNLQDMIDALKRHHGDAGACAGKTLRVL